MLAMVCVYLGLGSNIGNRRVNLARGIEHIKKIVTVKRVSTIIETAPLYESNQPDFLNMVLEAETDLPPHELLFHVKQLEQNLGRTEVRRFGPRNIDIDILYYGNQVITGADLTIPHPRLAERAFVLGPMCEIASTFVDPMRHKTISHLYSTLKDAG